MENEQEFEYEIRALITIKAWGYDEDDVRKNVRSTNNWEDWWVDSIEEVRRA